MKILMTLLLIGIAFATHAGPGRITYSYDENYRLTGANYHNEAVITYAYDRAGNMTDHMVLTDEKYLKPFLLYFTMTEYRLLGFRLLDC
ncbi:MAG: hypothetical protein EOM12_16570 [Verrucomicrobiae bacterium]|nr:hypothetical protein [Verrucomicrobiae bacterium]